MTCIVGLVHGPHVWLGGDSAGVGGYSLTVRRDPKVVRKGGFVFGFTSSFRMGQLLVHAFEPPGRSIDQDPHHYMVTTFVDALRTCLKAGGYARRTNEEETGGTFLVGYEGRLFKVEEDYQVGESIAPYDACGCGEDIARGALYAMAESRKPPSQQLLKALEAAEQHSAGVRAPFNIVTTSDL